MPLSERSIVGMSIGSAIIISVGKYSCGCGGCCCGGVDNDGDDGDDDGGCCDPSN